MNFSKLAFFILTTLISSVFSCTNNPISNEIINHATSNIATLTSSDTISFDIDKKTSLYNSSLQYFEHEQSSYLVYMNRTDRRLLFYDLDSKDEIFSVQFEKNGPNGVGEIIRDFHVISLDSILIAGQNYFELYLTDTSSAINKRIRPNSENSENRGMYPPRMSVGHNYKFMPLNGKIHFFCSPGGWRDNYHANFRKPVIVEIDINSEKWKYLNISYAPEYIDNNGYWEMVQTSPGTAKNGLGDLILSYPISHYIDVFKNDTIQRHYAGSNVYTKKIEAPFRKMPSSNDEMNVALMETPLYFMMRYDPFREVYYRIVMHPLSDQDPIQDINRIFVEKPFSIIILNKDFEKIGETEFPKNTYYTLDSFVGRDGLYLSLNHPDNPNINEDKIKYQLLKLEHNDN